MCRVLLFLFPMLTTAKIEVNIIGRNEGREPIEIYLTGHSVYPIGTAETVAFQLSEANLKDGVKVYLGQKPDDVFLRNPTPIGKLFTDYGWNPVMRVVNATSAGIVGIEALNKTLLRQVFVNKSPEPATFNVGISQTVTNVMLSKWRTQIVVRDKDPIKYTFDLKSLSGDWKTIIAFKEDFGVDSRKSETTQIGPSSAMQIVLQPGQSAKTFLYATLSTMNLEIEYTTRLKGRVIANYETLFNGHHFWSCDIAAIMSSVGLPYQFTSVEKLQVEFYWNVRVSVRDGMTNKKLMEVQY